MGSHVARIGNAILAFRGAYGFLSNLYVEPDGSHVEGEYQRAKCAFYFERHLFDGLSPLDAKRVGRRVTIREDWEDVKVDIMLFYVRKKFADHPDLLAKLVSTRPVQLVEGNTWGDTFWGVCRGQGLNALGEILMLVRDSHVG